MFQRLSLYISALAHDLDHRGKNNKFMADTASPLAAIYSTSTMENHHFNITVTILQQVHCGGMEKVLTSIIDTHARIHTSHGLISLHF